MQNRSAQQETAGLGAALQGETARAAGSADRLASCGQLGNTSSASRARTHATSLSTSSVPASRARRNTLAQRRLLHRASPRRALSVRTRGRRHRRVYSSTVTYFSKWPMYSCSSLSTKLGGALPSFRIACAHEMIATFLWDLSRHERNPLPILVARLVHSALPDPLHLRCHVFCHSQLPTMHLAFCLPTVSPFSFIAKCVSASE